MEKLHLLIPRWHREVAREFWRASSYGGGWATAAALLFLPLLHFLLRRRLRRSTVVGAPAVKAADHTSTSSVANIITEDDLRELISSLQVHPAKEREDWEYVISKGNDNISYEAWRDKKAVGPPRYLSVTTFERCSPEILRDFYMDSEFRKEWDNTLFSQDQLEVDVGSGTEVGRTIKKFPFLTPREYVLAWRVWEGHDNNFYCYIKECEHTLAPHQKKYVRVSHFRSGWCIRKVPGTDACEIRLVHEEANGMNVEMAKLAFAKGIWSYVCKMDRALRRYSSFYPRNSCSILTMRRLIKKAPPSMEIDTRDKHLETSNGIAVITQPKRGEKASKLIAKGILLVGTIVCLSQAGSSVGAQVAMACILKKLTNNNNSKNNNNVRSSKGKNN
ncbi:Polyketide cyclase/dehydrase and lipid transport superfamily protein [Rhynchospora pubera]|uniref:Polyketide cyclase/dehydrase and lipid transport superfamily protein n=1 Tax=Rhynchospora pubera TaxID=906938 RepID=A0AAV8FQH5_9POAL|nr:Polyketide cyclase/dehydrase and lipid transport superfamily protein [Rhynchospora pubera]